MRSALLAIGLAIGAIVIGVILVDFWLLDEGEVVTLHTISAEGEPYETQVWLVEDVSLGEGTWDEGTEGVLWLRAHSPGADWLKRLQSAPEVELARNGSRQPYRAGALEDAALRQRLNRAMAEKYGPADRMVGWLADPSLAVPVRLELDRARAATRLGSGHEPAPR